MLIQRIGLAGYGLLARAGLMKVPLLRRAYYSAYDLYKRRLEAASVDGLRRFVPEGCLVVDAGANIGFFTVRFASWVGASGRVLAVEPDAENMLLLRQRLTLSGVGDRVETYQAVVAAAPGTLTLRRNSVHPGDHRISTDGSGVPIRAETIDRLVAAHPQREVAFLKIDVQGAEMLVLKGAAATLRRATAIFVEIDPASLREFGTSPDAVIEFLAGFGYSMRRLSRDGVVTPLEKERLREILDDRGYTDVLFVRSTRQSYAGVASALV